MLRLTMLGALALESDRGSLAGAALRRRPLALLALVATAPHGVTRDKLLAYFWPESDTAHARNCLNQTLFALRRDVGEPLFRPAGCSIRLNPEVIDTDRWTFERSLDCGALQEAIEAYGGPFLDGFHVGELVEFERWVETERRRMGDRYERALQALEAVAERSGDRVTALHWWRLLAEHDPLSSRIAAELVRALLAVGDRAEAVRTADAHRRLLQSELGALPVTGEFRSFERLWCELRGISAAS